MEKTGSYGKDGQLWKRRAVMEKTDSYGKDGLLWKRQAYIKHLDIKKEFSWRLQDARKSK